MRIAALDWIARDPDGLTPASSERRLRARLIHRVTFLLLVPLLALASAGAWLIGSPGHAWPLLLALLLTTIVAMLWLLRSEARARSVLSATNAELEEHAQRSRALLDAVTALSSPVSLSQALETALPLLTKAVGARYAILFLPSSERSASDMVHVVDADRGRIAVSDDLIAEIARRGTPPPGARSMLAQEPIVINEVTPGLPLYDLARRFGIRSMVAIPLSNLAGNAPLGALSFAYTESRQFADSLLDFLRTAAYPVCGTIATATLLEELLSLNERLETLVEERTDEMIRAQQQVLQAGRLTAMGELAAGVAHELNTPLGTITGYSQFATERLSGIDGSTDDVARYLSVIEQEAGRCSTIVKNLLQFTRPTSAGFEPADLAVLVKRAIELVRHHLDMHRVEIVVENAPANVRVDAHPEQLVQVFMNLLINAQHAMPEGGVIRIMIAPSPEQEGFAEVAFADTGSGIAPEHLALIFEPFFTTKPVGKGTGLGLSVSYGIVQQHGGTIVAESMVGRGTVMRIRLPISANAYPEEVRP